MRTEKKNGKTELCLTSGNVCIDESKLLLLCTSASDLESALTIHFEVASKF